ncbi:MAG: helix-hairpin-helix domain-containing protein [Pseudomonadota bacterium]
MRILRTLLAVATLAASAVVLAEPVDINTADAATISAELTGVGLARAQAIVDYRDLHGPFRSVDELLNVKGIGERTLELNAENIRLGSNPT